MSSLLNIGLSGVAANQARLSTTGHNITNVDTDGYSRQQVITVTRDPQNYGFGYLGKGVGMDGVRRMANEYVSEQLRMDTSNAKEIDIFTQQISQIDDLLASADTGIGQGISSFFNAVQTAANNPSSEPERQLVVSQAEGLIHRMEEVHTRLIQQTEGINTQITSMTNKVNELARGIADLNAAISQVYAVNQQQPNDLLDKRDEKLRELSELVRVDVYEQDDKSINVTVGMGQALVLGDQTNQLQFSRGAADPSRYEIELVTNYRTIPVTNSIVGGQLGGLVKVREEVIDPTINAVGRLAISISETFNHLHQQGMDLNNDLGRNFFTDLNHEDIQRARVFGYDTNRGKPAPDILVEVTDSSLLTDKDYELRAINPPEQFQLYDKRNGQRINASYNYIQDTTSIPTVKKLEIEADGLKITINSTLNGAAGNDKYLISPTRSAADDIDLAIETTDELALALPLRVEANQSNVGTGAVDLVDMQDIHQLDATGFDDEPIDNFSIPGKIKQPLMIRFVDETHYEILDANNPSAGPIVTEDGTVLENLEFIPGTQNKVLPEAGEPGYFGYQITLSGRPATGDTFSIDYNQDGVSDNRNGLRLAELANARTMDNQVTYQQSYSKLVERIGLRTSEARIESETDTKILQQTQALRESYAGVNMNEEAANLLRFQQAYSASARLITTAKEMFDTLLSSVGR
ncbi:flagellar hook-associated protein 1 FlgK [Allopseudospirillum japonicum]|uniref:Flagellar hook-associated protein 1 n=1 Tax=Allopseudospirillum japonicum TaxID=64971 RepID=A0A1H6QME2_9GAMM|nr:flagellar hook-associated protein FlgK [Allopseudospirillum japonicum]SEI44799.1 flagellar hook-associated protein 1 FlgK [Allopseudospirillum japonicum]